MVICAKSWLEIKRTGTEEIDFKKQFGERLTPNCILGDNSIIDAPMCFAKDTSGNIYLGQYYQKILRINETAKITGSLNIPVEDPLISNQGIAYVRGLDFNADYVAVVSQTRHVVRIYSLIDYSLFAEIGLFNDPGNVNDGKLNDPRSVLWLTNGNLLVISNNGVGSAGGGDEGHVTEYDNAGNLVQTRLSNFSDGQSSIGNSTVTNPRKAVYDPVDPSFLWIGEARGRLLKVNSSWQIEEIIYPQCGFDTSSLESFCFTADGNIAIASVDFGGVIVIDPETSDVISTIHLGDYNASRDIRDIIELEPGVFAVTVWSERNLERGVYLVSINESLLIQYESFTVPIKYTLNESLLPNNFDCTTSQLTVPITHINCIPDNIIIPLKGSC